MNPTLEPRHLLLGRCPCGGPLVEDRMAVGPLYVGPRVRRFACTLCGRDGFVRPR